MLEAQPFIGELYDTLVGGVPRPANVTGEHYPRVSNAFFNRVHDVLSGELTAEQGLEQLERELTRMSRRGW